MKQKEETLAYTCNGMQHLDEERVSDWIKELLERRLC